MLHTNCIALSPGLKSPTAMHEKWFERKQKSLSQVVTENICKTNIDLLKIFNLNIDTNTRKNVLHYSPSRKHCYAYFSESESSKHLGAMRVRACVCVYSEAYRLETPTHQMLKLRSEI